MLASDQANINQDEALTVEDQTSFFANSDRIRLKFGNYGIEVIENDPRIRVSNLFSSSGGVKTNRTFAVVMYPSVIEAAFRTEHEAIINGQSIGIVFKENGWQIDKRHQYVGELEPFADTSSVHTVFGDIGEIQPVIHVYSLIVEKDSARFHYASIAEVHHPDYIGLEELKTICGGEPDGTPANDQDTIDFLQIVARKMQGV